MVGRKLLGLVGLLAWLAGCGGGSDFAKSSAMPGSSYAESSSHYGGGGGSEQPSSAPSDARVSTQSSGGHYEQPQAQETQRERPGLGTGWGETRTSHVHEVAFERDSSRPFAMASLHYNDRRGVEALASYRQAVAGGFFHDVPSGGGAITVSIIGEGGSALDALKVGDRTYVVGREGERYSIVMTNHTNHRFETVASVDGLDVVNGRPASLEGRGYILAPFARLEIDGFRQSQSAVAAFRFSRTSESYAAQTSGDRDVGVIGVAFFNERGDAFEPWTFDELRTRDTATPFPADPRYARPPQ